MLLDTNALVGELARRGRMCISDVQGMARREAFLEAIDKVNEIRIVDEALRSLANRAYADTPGGNARKAAFLEAIELMEAAARRGPVVEITDEVVSYISRYGPGVEITNEVVSYISRYGGRCRDCADHHGVCPSSGLPCKEPGDAIRSVLEALNYGLTHGYITRTAQEIA